MVLPYHHLPVPYYGSTTCRYGTGTAGGTILPAAAVRTWYQQVVCAGTWYLVLDGMVLLLLLLLLVPAGTIPTVGHFT